jgi:hypothetical protein
MLNLIEVGATTQAPLLSDGQADEHGKSNR